MVSASRGGEPDNTWFFDSGDSAHMTSRKEWLHDFKQLNPPGLSRINGLSVKDMGGWQELVHGYV